MHIRELYLHTRNLKETRHFYKKLLGFELVHESERYLEFAAGTTKLVFQASAGKHAVYHVAFTIPSNQIQEALTWAQAKVEILEVAPGEKIADFTNWHAQAFYFLDNNHNVLEFIARFDLQEQASHAFSAASLLSVSEIGLVTGNVTATCRWLQEEFAIDIYSRQPPTENFAVSGDDHGLFIVVKENRNWFPTKIQAPKSWVKVIFESAGNKLHVLECNDR